MREHVPSQVTRIRPEPMGVQPVRPHRAHRFHGAHKFFFDVVQLLGLVHLVETLIHRWAFALWATRRLKYRRRPSTVSCRAHLAPPAILDKARSDSSLLFFLRRPSMQIRSRFFYPTIDRDAGARLVQEGRTRQRGTETMDSSQLLSTGR